MGLRGPLRQPDSYRGSREMPGFRLDDPETPKPPAHLSSRAKRIFKSLVGDLVGAKVPIKKVDGHAIAMAAYCINATQEWTEKEKAPSLTPKDALEISRMIARFQRDAQAWMAAICATPQARARIGLRSTEKPKADTVKKILEARQARAS